MASAHDSCESFLGTGKLVSLRRPRKQQESEGDAPSQQRRSHLGDWGAGTEETEARARPGRAFERSRLQPQTGSHRRLIRPASNSAATATTAVASAVACCCCTLAGAAQFEGARGAAPRADRSAADCGGGARRAAAPFGGGGLAGQPHPSGGTDERAEQAHSSRQCGRRHRTARARWRVPACSRRPSCGPPRDAASARPAARRLGSARGTPCLALARRPDTGLAGFASSAGSRSSGHVLNTFGMSR